MHHHELDPLGFDFKTLTKSCPMCHDGFVVGAMPRVTGFFSLVSIFNDGKLLLRLIRLSML
ncbi:hypothetical protein GF325_04515 [Candidatus Bathyarchaeota archaeon]|nr:hypothetical protein [Candidatus Bathyarchaeota archaeon]